MVGTSFASPKCRTHSRPDNGVSGLVSALARGVEDDMAAFFPGEISRMAGVLEAVNRGLIRVLDGLEQDMGACKSRMSTLNLVGLCLQSWVFVCSPLIA